MKNNTFLAFQHSHWSASYLGLRDADITGPQRPSACWELVRHVYRGERGVFLSGHSAGSGWHRVAEAEDFDLVVFQQGGVAAHVGVVAGEPWRMLHLPEGGASCVERFDNGSFLPRLNGIYRRDAIEVLAPPHSAPVDGVGLLGVPFLNPEAGEALGVPAGRNLYELVAILYPATSEEQRARMRVTVGRADLPRERWTEFTFENWRHVTPRAGVLVAVEPLPGAVPWGKVVALLAITAALAAGQFYLGPLIAASSFAAFSGTLGTLAVSTGVAALSLVIQGLAPGPSSQTDNPMFAATGWENRARLFEPLPIPAGKTRDAPPYAAPPYISIGAGAKASNVAWKYVFSSTTTNSDPGPGVLRFSGGAAVGFPLTLRVDDLDDDGVSRAAKLAAFDASGDTFNFTVYARGEHSTRIDGTVTSFSPQSGYTNIVVAVSRVSLVAFVDTDNVVLKLSSQGDADNSLYLHGVFLEAIGEGEVSQRRFGDTPTGNFDNGEDNPVEVEEALINPGDPWPFETYPHTVVAVDPSTMGATFDSKDVTTDWVIRVAPRDCTQLEVFLSWTSGLYNTNQSDGAAETNTVQFQWQYRLVGDPTWTDPGDWTSEGNDYRAQFFRSHIWTVPRGDYEVRHRKTDRDDNFDIDSSQDTYVWIALQGHRPEVPFKCRAPVTATAFRVRSTDQLQGTIKAYNRIFSRKALDWNGSAWVMQETANPAAFYRYRLQTPALAVPYADDDINLSKLASWAGYCNENSLEYNSPDAGSGKSLLDALTEVANAGRSRVHRYNTKWSVIIDRSYDLFSGGVIAGHVTPANGWAISVTTTRTPEADCFRVTFKDETSDYATKTRVVPFPGVEEDEVSKPLALDMPGVTDPSQVYREAMRLYYLMFVYRLPKYTATAAWDHMTYEAGDRVIVDDGFSRSRVSALVVNPMLALGDGFSDGFGDGFGGSDSEFSPGNVITLSQPVTMEEGQDYQIRFRHLPPFADENDDSPPALSIIRDVMTVPGTWDQIFLTDSGVTPSTDDLVIFGPAGDVGIHCIVDQITAGDDLSGVLQLYPDQQGLDFLIAGLTVPPWDGRLSS